MTATVHGTRRGPPASAPGNLLSLGATHQLTTLQWVLLNVQVLQATAGSQGCVSCELSRPGAVQLSQLKCFQLAKLRQQLQQCCAVAAATAATAATASGLVWLQPH